MPTKVGGYRTADGVRQPSVTTITGMWGDKNGMIYAANRLALEPLLRARGIWNADGGDGYPELDYFFRTENPDEWDHKIKWGKIADAGTAAHEMFDCWGRGIPFDSSRYTPAVLEIAEPAFAAAKNWAEQSKYQVLETEVSLVSEKYRFGGTRDGVMVSGKRCIVDVKTSKAIYPEYLMQVAAYGILDEEAGNKIEGYYLLHFSKQEKPEDPIHWSQHHWSHLDSARECFLLLRKAYDLMKDIEKLAK